MSLQPGDQIWKLRGNLAPMIPMTGMLGMMTLGVDLPNVTRLKRGYWQSPPFSQILTAGKLWAKANRSQLDAGDQLTRELAKHVKEGKRNWYNLIDPSC